MRKKLKSSVIVLVLALCFSLALVACKNDPVPKSLDITTTKTEYYVGEDFAKSSCTVKVKYDKGDDTTVSVADAELTWDIPSFSTLGQKTITATYKGVSGIFTVTVREKVPLRIEMFQKPTLTTYYVGQDFAPAGGIVRIVYEDGSHEDINMPSTRVDVTGYKKNEIGTHKITVTYTTGGQSYIAEFNVTVQANPTEKIEIAAQLTEKIYVLGEALNLAGGSITVTHEYGAPTTVLMTSSEVTVTGFDTDTAGEQTITVAYDSKTTTFTVHVYQVLSAVIVRPTKTVYILGEQLDLAGGILRLNLGVDISKDIPLSKTTVTGYKTNEESVQTLTVSYLETVATFTVEVMSAPEDQLHALMAGGFPTFTYGNGDEANWQITGDKDKAKRAFSLMLMLSDEKITALSDEIDFEEIIKVSFVIYYQEYIALKNSIDTYLEDDVLKPLDAAQIEELYALLQAAKDLSEILNVFYLNFNSIKLFTIGTRIDRISTYVVSVLIRQNGVYDGLLSDVATAWNIIELLDVVSSPIPTTLTLLNPFKDKINQAYNLLASLGSSSNVQNVCTLATSLRNDFIDVFYTYYSLVGDSQKLNALELIALPYGIQAVIDNFLLVAKVWYWLSPYFEESKFYDATEFLLLYRDFAAAIDYVTTYGSSYAKQMYSTMELEQSLIKFNPGMSPVLCSEWLEFFTTEYYGYNWFTQAFSSASSKAFLEFYLAAAAAAAYEGDYSAVPELLNRYIALTPQQQYDFYCLIFYAYPYNYTSAPLVYLYRAYDIPNYFHGMIFAYFIENATAEEYSAVSLLLWISEDYIVYSKTGDERALLETMDYLLEEYGDLDLSNNALLGNMFDIYYGRYESITSNDEILEVIHLFYAAIEEWCWIYPHFKTDDFVGGYDATDFLIIYRALKEAIDSLSPENVLIYNDLVVDQTFLTLTGGISAMPLADWFEFLTEENGYDYYAADFDATGIAFLNLYLDTVLDFLAQDEETEGDEIDVSLLIAEFIKLTPDQQFTFYSLLFIYYPSNYIQMPLVYMYLSYSDVNNYFFDMIFVYQDVIEEDWPLLVNMFFVVEDYMLYKNDGIMVDFLDDMDYLLEEYGDLSDNEMVGGMFDFYYAEYNKIPQRVRDIIQGFNATLEEWYYIYPGFQLGYYDATYFLIEYRKLAAAITELETNGTAAEKLMYAEMGDVNQKWISFTGGITAMPLEDWFDFLTANDSYGYNKYAGAFADATGKAFLNFYLDTVSKAMDEDFSDVPQLLTKFLELTPAQQYDFYCLLFIHYPSNYTQSTLLQLYFKYSDVNNCFFDMIFIYYEDISQDDYNILCYLLIALEDYIYYIKEGDVSFFLTDIEYLIETYGETALKAHTLFGAMFTKYNTLYLQHVTP